MSVPSLRWLQIHRYEQFDAVRIEFSERENLILGINGAGKTRLLRLIRAVLSQDFGEVIDRPFDVEFEFATGVLPGIDAPVVIHGRVQNEDAMRLDTDGEYPESLSLRATTLRASIVYDFTDSRVSCELKDGELSFRDSSGLFVETAPYSGEGFLRPPFTRKDRRKMAKRMALISGFRSVFVGEADREFQVLTSEIEYLINAIPLRQLSLEFQSRTERLVRGDMFPLLFQVATHLDRAVPGISPSWFEFSRGSPDMASSIADELLRVEAAIGLSHILLVPRIVREKGTLLECRGLGLRVRFRDGTEVVESELTFGQRRFLYASLMLLSHPGAPFLMDEIDNGLHPRLVETLLKELSGRQIFLASHNKIVIDYTNFAGPEDVQRKIHIVQRGEDGRQSVLRLDDETAQNVFAKISVAIQSPSDVLLAEGLW